LVLRILLQFQEFWTKFCQLVEHGSKESKSLADLAREPWHMAEPIAGLSSQLTICQVDSIDWWSTSGTSWCSWSHFIQI